MNIISTPHAPEAIGPYSQGTVTGNLLFTSMQIPIDPENGDMPEGIEPQTFQVLMNLKAIAKAAGSSMHKAVKITVYMQDLNDFKAMNRVYAEFFPVDSPARAAVEVDRIPKDVLVAMDAIFEIA
jgi:2-iminobutanoate/2-iminopropanoate deaminase